MEQLDPEASMSSHHANDCEEVGRRQLIETKLQEIVNDVNENRKRHAETMAKFKQELDKQARKDDTFDIKNLQFVSSAQGGFTIKILRKFLGTFIKNFQGMAAGYYVLLQVFFLCFFSSFFHRLISKLYVTC